ncbi:MAG: hypothetical protein IKQ54_03270, partial [Oscillospiraceae bacterium]|nr:hypothetical protein [Oscillospiraceae bacterium]
APAGPDRLLFPADAAVLSAFGIVKRLAALRLAFSTAFSDGRTLWFFSQMLPFLRLQRYNK